jgi:flagellum-specific peptidoglycan hydrolase FlgJ
MLKKKGWLWVIKGSEYAPYLDWIVAQSQHETGNWKSKLFTQYNNLFGMKVPTRRKFFGIGGVPAPDGGEYANYKTWADSAKDFLEWLRYNKFPTDLGSVDTYVKVLMEKRYLTDGYDNYLNGVKHWISVGYDKNLNA